MKDIIKIMLISLLLLLTTDYGLRTNAYAGVPHLLNYQGRLTDVSNVPLNGSYSLTFRIYDAETAGNLLWEEINPAVVIQKGIFNVLLGSVTALNLPFDKQYYVEIKVGSEVMTPRQQIASAAYAITAENAVPKGVVVMWSGLISAIPSGWALCDGTNSTPDLRNRFIRGVPNSSTNPGATGGANTHTHGAGSYVGPNHTHTINTKIGSYSYRGNNYYLGVTREANSSEYETNRYGAPAETILTTAAGNTAITGASASADSLPLYYQLAFIIKL